MLNEQSAFDDGYDRAFNEPSRMPHNPFPDRESEEDYLIWCNWSDRSDDELERLAGIAEASDQIERGTLL